MHVVTLLNEKGGVGKTTLATHIAAGLAIRGYRVLIIDADPQGHATFSFGLEKFGGLFELLVREAEFKDVLKAPSPNTFAVPDEPVRGRLFVLPGSIETRAIPNLIDDVSLLTNRLDDLQDIIDVVIFDTPPTPSLLHSSIYLATDGVIYPTTCEMLSFDGLAASIGRRQQFINLRRQMNRPPIDILSIVPTMFQRQTALHQHNLKLLTDQFGSKVWPPIPQRTIWREASNNRVILYAFAPSSKAAGDAWRLVDRVEKGINAWQRRS